VKWVLSWRGEERKLSAAFGRKNVLLIGEGVQCTPSAVEGGKEGEKGKGGWPP